ncbi:F-box protein SKIP23-like isoform X1 [Silene latifolia]|uniref:F-box protein SKIP23-like isoform X1 n=1 Tax=Silene latifolia TaxID=37657 RepID=UPI003D76B9C8
MSADWSTLPLDLLGNIAFKMDSFEDFIYFSAVCRSWNCASSSIKHLWRAPSLPWLLLAENTQGNPNCLRNIFNLNNNKHYSLNLPETFGARCWGSPYGWIAMAKRDLTVQLFNPFTKANISFPSLQTLPHLPIYEPGSFDDSWYDYYDWVLMFFLQKLIVLKVPQSGGHHEFVIILLSPEYKGLSFAKCGDQAWTTILIEDLVLGVYDVLVMNDLVFALYNYDGAIAYWSVKEFYGAGVVKPTIYSPGKYRIFERLNVCTNYAYLVQSGSDLLMVLRFKEDVMDSDDLYDIVYRTIEFKIYKLNPKDQNWENIKDLGDIVLFVGDNSSMSVSLAHAKGLRQNSVYFTDDDTESWLCPPEQGGILAGRDMGVFNLRTNRIERFYEGNDRRSSICSPTWFIPHFKIVLGLGSSY